MAPFRIELLWVGPKSGVVVDGVDVYGQHLALGDGNTCQSCLSHRLPVCSYSGWIQSERLVKTLVQVSQLVGRFKINRFLKTKNNKQVLIGMKLKQSNGIQ